MPKTTYVPTETDRLTGQNVRRLRRAAGETLTETIERASLTFSGQSMSRVELGQRQLTVPEATKLAAHFNTTVDKIIVKDEPFRELWNEIRDPSSAVTEQAWLGNPEPTHLFAVPDRAEQVGEDPNFILIYRLEPLTPEQYREQVWIPYLETRYSNDMKAS